jgi:hypothetical protein
MTADAHDALFGSLVMVGLGGVHTDVLGDRSFRSLPLTDQDAAAMWCELGISTAARDVD